MKVNVFLVDDEHLAISELKYLLKEFPELDIIGTATSPNEAINQIQKIKVDMLFLDIQMPGLNGFDLLESLQDVPKVVFVTAYDQYAVKAFEINALDYLLKPIHPQRLKYTIDKVKAEFLATTETSPKFHKFNPERRLFLRSGDRCFFVHLFQIRHIESEGNYSWVTFEKERIQVRSSLNQWVDKLPEPLFFRANRKEILNTDEIIQIEPWFNNTLLVKIRDGKSIELSIRQSFRFKELMGL